MLLGILFAVISWFRKKMQHTGDNTVALPFMLEGLKEMLASGQIGQAVLDKGVNDTEKSISMSSHPYNVDDDNHKRGGDTRRPDDEE